MNTKILDIIMGKSDSVTMKEKMDFALDESMQLDLRLEALDDLEMVRTLLVLVSLTESSICLVGRAHRQCQ